MLLFNFIQKAQAQIQQAKAQCDCAGYLTEVKTAVENGTSELELLNTGLDLLNNNLGVLTDWLMIMLGFLLLFAIISLIIETK